MEFSSENTNLISRNIAKSSGLAVKDEELPVDFQLPPELEAHEPPEARGIDRDGVRLMVSFGARPGVIHTTFRNLPNFFHPGDVLVINTSKTINAAVNVQRAQDGIPLELHLSNRLTEQEWIVELRQPAPIASEPFFSAHASEELILPGGGKCKLIAPFQASAQAGTGDRVRLWYAIVETDLPMGAYLERYGFPIRYKHVPHAWSLPYYQTVYAAEPGSAEMPSAGRAFTPAILDRLKAGGVIVTPLILHTGVASLEDHESPPPEYYRVPPETARAINHAHQRGRRVVAVGTTVIRALETVTGEDRLVQAGEGWTDLLITPRQGILAVDGLLTGFHEPRSTHLMMLEALAGRDHIQHTYAEAIRRRYLWHEFGDLHLILP